MAGRRPGSRSNNQRKKRPSRSERGQKRHAERAAGSGAEKHGRPSRNDRPARDDRPAPRPGQRPAPQNTPAAGKPFVIVKGSIEKNAKGFAFLAYEDRRREDAFIPPREAARLFHGDRVEARLDSRGGLVGMRVIEHRARELVGRYQLSDGYGTPARIVWERRKAREEIAVAAAHPAARPDDWVRAKLVFTEQGPRAEILEVYGKMVPASADVGTIAAEFGLTEAHTPEAEREASSLKLDLAGDDREDFRHVPFITIDGETARDFDDAIHVERQAGGGFILWVAIADVSHYVKPGTALDREARARGTSVYFPERAFHMLPRALSENLCSLRPKEPRLTMVARMVHDAHGKRQSVTVHEGIIESRRRATYNEIQAEHDARGTDPSWEYVPHFALYRLLRKLRSERGSIDFELPEAEIKIDDKGNPVSIENRPRLDAHRLIEEFMISANEAVTEWALKRNWPFIYRVHDDPTEQALEKFSDLAAQFGVAVPAARAGALPKVLAEVIKGLTGHPAQDLLNISMLRSMKQAVYSAAHGSHFGLASPGYTHFTSPIRRYPDLVVHRQLRHALRVEKKREKRPDTHGFEKMEHDLADVAEHCSYRERVAAEADREAIRLKQARFMAARVGEEFDGRVNGMNERGLFIQLIYPYVEGRVSLDTLTDDHYEFRAERMTVIGRRSGRAFKIGKPARVRVARVDIDLRQIEFDLISGGEAGGPEDRGPRPRGAGQKPRRGGHGGDGGEGRRPDGGGSRTGKKLPRGEEPKGGGKSRRGRRGRRGMRK